MRLSLYVRDVYRIEVIADMLTRKAEFETLPLTVGDTLPSLEFELTQEDGSPYNLVGAAVKFFFKKYGAAAHSNTNTSCTITQGVSGLCKYEWGSGDIANEGLHVGEIEITKSGKKLSLPYTLRFDVRAQIE